MNDGQPETSKPKSGRWRRRLLWLGALLLLLVALTLSVAALWLRSTARAALPQLEGEISLAGLSGPVAVRRDAHGVPHIEAASQDDLWLAQGFVTAQDRLWQMDSLRRAARGELAEILGPGLVERDVAQRLLRIGEVADRLYAAMGPEERRRYARYAEGVNLLISRQGERLPLEFRLLRYRPRPWTGADSVAVGLTMVQTLDTHWPAKLGRERVEAALHHDPQLIADLYPVGSWRDRPPVGVRPPPRAPRAVRLPGRQDDEEEDDEDAPEDEYSVAALELPRLLQSLSLPACEGCQPGSNNWAISGAHTASGRPLLANDMHLALSAPGLWYVADLRAPGYHAAGLTLPGAPLIVAGHNEHVAWGFTALHGDVQDLYVETLDGRGRYRDASGQWRPLESVRETIRVRGEPDRSVLAQKTAHGPVLTPMLKGERRALALAWTLYDRALGLPPIYQLNTAASARELDALLGGWSYPTQNVVFADDQGHIGYRAAGKAPLRRAGLQDKPIPAALSAEWRGYIPFEKMPNAFDPPSGLLATANARVTAPDAPLALSDEWADPYRIERIHKVLDERDGLRAADMLALQSDVYSEVNQELAHRFAYAALHTAREDARLRQAAGLLNDWDGRMSADSAAASIVSETRAQLRKRILAARLGREASAYSWSESGFAFEEIVMRANPDWLPRGTKSWDELIVEAMRRALREGRAPEDLRRWAYGGWRTIEAEHPLARYLPLFGRLANSGAQPLQGDATTVLQARSGFGPSQRFTMDWSDIDGSTESLVMGQSGQPLSLFYSDQWRGYLAGQSFALPFTPAAVASQSRYALRLTP